jgi:hypothetical protein
MVYYNNPDYIFEDTILDNDININRPFITFDSSIYDNLFNNSYIVRKLIYYSKDIGTVFIINQPSHYRINLELRINMDYIFIEPTKDNELIKYIYDNYLSFFPNVKCLTVFFTEIIKDGYYIIYWNRSYYQNWYDNIFLIKVDTNINNNNDDNDLVMI